MKKLIITIAILILAGVSIVGLFYPDYSSSNKKEYFVGTIVIEIVNADSSKIVNFKDNALAKEAMNNTIKYVNYKNVSSVLKQIGYDSIINLQEAFDGMELSSEKQYLTITIKNFDGIYVEKMATELGDRLTRKLINEPYYQLSIAEETRIERYPTLGGFLGRRIGEEITVAIFVVIWIIILGVILSKEMKENQNDNI